MKPFAKIVVPAALLFTVICIAQDWRSFFRVDAPAAPAPAELTAEVQATVQRYALLTRHAYQSGGEPGFLERLPASEAVVRELVAELDYLRKNRRVQMIRSTRLEVLEVRPLSSTRALATTAEEWVYHTADLTNGARIDEDRVQTAFVEYRLERTSSGWQVAGWKLTSPPQPASASEGP